MIDDWMWDNDDFKYTCPHCYYSFDDIEIFDEIDAKPSHFGMKYCPHCGTRLVREDTECDQ